MEDLNAESIDKIAALAVSSEISKVPDGGNIPYVVVPDGYRVETLGHLIFNEHTERPERVKQTVTVLDPASFVEYFKNFSDSESRVFAFEPKREVTAVLDYHEAGPQGNESIPRWGQHKLVLSMRHSEEWNTWTGKNNKQMSQGEFADFLEQSSVNISDPDPAHMREVASDMQATVEGEFGQKAERQNGSISLKWSETVKATVGGGKLSVPETFVISIPVFIGGPAVQIKAFLRFKISGGKLALWYSLLQPEQILRQAFQAAREEIQEEIGTRIINGTIA